MSRITKAFLNIFLCLLLIAGIIAAGILCYVLIGAVVEMITEGVGFR